MIVKVPVDTQCYEFINRPKRARQVINELLIDFVEIGNMMPYQVAQLLGGLASHYEKVERGDALLHDNVNKEDTDGTQEECREPCSDDDRGDQGEGEDQGEGGPAM